MRVNTKYFGEMDVTDKERIRFPEPLPGFEKSSEYVIVRFYDDDDSLLCMQSLQEEELAFVLVNPFYIVQDYTVSLSPEDHKTLKSDPETPLAFYAIAVPHEDWKDSTVNLKCPIAVNPARQLGKQLIMDDTSYSMRHPIDSGNQKGE